MPHLDLSAENLDILYPPLEAPADDRLEDLVDDKDDSVFQAGLKIAENIRSDMHVRGRRRRGAGESMTGLLGESSARRRGIHTDRLGLVGESCLRATHTAHGESGRSHLRIPDPQGLVGESSARRRGSHTEEAVREVPRTNNPKLPLGLANNGQRHVPCNHTDLFYYCFAAGPLTTCGFGFLTNQS